MIRKTKHSRTVVVMDVDGVIADFCFSMTKIMKELFGTPEYPIGTFQAEDWGVEWLGLKKSHEDEFWDYIRESETPFWENEREMIPGIVRKAYEVFRKHDLVWYFCTTRDDCKVSSAQEQTKNFLHFNGFYDANVIVSDKKGDFCNSVNADYFIDDKFSNCEEVREKSPNTKVVFLALASQAKYKERGHFLDMTVVTSTQQFLDILSTLPYNKE